MRNMNKEIINNDHWMEFITLSKMKKILRKQEVTKMNGATSSEGDAKSIDDSKSNCESDDGNLFSCGSFCSFLRS